MKFLIATNNAHKLTEIKAILSPLGIECVTLREAGVLSDPDETGLTFAENAFIKAKSAMRASGMPAFADDSGLAVDALGGAPGIYSSRYAGDNATDDDRINKLLNELCDVPEDKRTARFICSICCVFPDGRKITAEGESVGHIAFEKIADNGFGYDPIFIENSTGKCFAEIVGDEKNRVSHRGNALRAFAKELSDFLAKNPDMK